MSKYLELVKTFNPKLAKIMCFRWERHATLIDIYVDKYRDSLVERNLHLISDDETRRMKEIEEIVTRYKGKLTRMVERDRCEFLNTMTQNKKRM
jgi:hypothetical protein